MMVITWCQTLLVNEKFKVISTKKIIEIILGTENENEKEIF